ncbi:TonB-dependent receptor domain-containing protein [Polluticaenibacter yanchengensis]|uniref:TonB-dependent receptor n=1 Tax=Polluticaenibacter yanchengensis TaxID=3014562 RepID=A0ABT4UMS6_9BACT|nr:TonB-dependent receptor [Chitinophagaceae bacterium LY-5]
MKKKMAKKICLLLVVLSPVSIFAQTKISGKIIEANSKKSIQGVTVSVVGNTAHTISNINGEFIITLANNVDVKQQLLKFTSVGYESKEQSLKDIDVSKLFIVELREDLVKLDEVVVTGQGLSVSKRRLSTNVTTISAEQIKGLPVNRIDQLLQSQVPNAQIKMAGGQAGGGSIIQTRGFNSAFANSTPIIYVDGVRVDNLNTAATLGMSLSGGTAQGTATSSLADIPVENIEKIEFINGGAATTLYGSDAANGVLQIFTKKSGSGKANIGVQADMGLEKGTGDFFYFKRTKELLFRDAFTQRYSVTADGGNSDFGFSAAASYAANNGYIIHDNNKSDKFDFRAGFHAKISNKVTYESSITYGRQTLTRNRNGNSGGYSALWFLENGASKVIGGGFNYKLDSASTEEYARIRSFVDSAEMLQNNASLVNRFQTSQVIKYQALKNLLFKATAGIDYRAQTEQSIVTNAFNRLIKSASTGSISKFDRNYWGITLELTGQHEAKVGDFSFLTTAGTQLFKNTDRQVAYSGQDLLDGGLTVGLGATRNANEYYAEIVSSGVYLQENIGYKNRYFLDLGIRGDNNSAFGSTIGTQWYPKVGVSYILSSEPFFQNWDQNILTTVKFRANYGVAGNFPPPFVNETTLTPGGFDGKQAIGFGQSGNTDIKPEKSYSKEIGFDFGLFRNRVLLTATYFNNQTKDALFIVPPASSTGQDSYYRNIGVIENKGFEFAVMASVIETKDFDLKIRASANTVDNLVVSSGGAASFNLSGMSTRTIQTVVKEGYPVGYISGYYGYFNADGTYKSSDPQAFLGSTISKLTGSFGLNIRYKRLSFFANADYQQGGYFANWNKQFRFNYGASTEGVPAAEVAKNGTLNWLNFSQLFVDKSDFLKIRTMGINYTFDKANLGNAFKRLSVGISAVNPFNFTASDADPEAIMPGGAQGQGSATTGGVAYAQFSAPRQFIATIKVNF